MTAHHSFILSNHTVLRIFIFRLAGQASKVSGHFAFGDVVIIFISRSVAPCLHKKDGVIELVRRVGATVYPCVRVSAKWEHIYFNIP
jgi:hypothetical protein